MVAYFTELHNKVHEVFHFLLRLSHHEQVFSGNLASDSLVKGSLSVSHCAENFLFSFRRNFLFNISLKPSKHEWL